MANHSVMPKPRLRLYDSMWWCFLARNGQRRVMGMGYTPKHAYNDWLQQQRLAGGVRG